MRKTTALGSLLLMCSPLALADGMNFDPREVADDTYIEAEATVKSDADVDIDTKPAMDVSADADLDVDADFNADADMDIDTNIDDRFERLAKATLAEFRELDTSFDALADRAYGYAVFDSTKGGLIVTGTGGTGVAINARTGEKTYMRVGGAGLGLGAGLQTFKLVLLFETRDEFNEFTNGDWNANAAAQAVIGEAGASATADFENGVAAYQMDQEGLMAQIDLTGLKFWVADKLETKNS